jgi:hypothetical protein
MNSYPQPKNSSKQQWMSNESASKNETNSWTTKDAVECLSTTMLLPKEFYDVSGQRCDVVGTSLHTWANPDGQFCHVPYGKCMSNQLGALYKEDLKRIARNEKPKYLVSPIVYIVLYLSEKIIDGKTFSNWLHWKKSTFSKQ